MSSIPLSKSPAARASTPRVDPVPRRRHRARAGRSGSLPIALRLPGAMLVAELDSLAVTLAAQLAHLERPIAHAAYVVDDARAWRLEGYARKSDYARELLDRSSRWLSDRSVLGRAMQVAPALGDALVGDDGGAPIGAVAAVEIARLLDGTNELALGELPRWVARARSVSTQQLRVDARALRRELREGPEAALRLADTAATSCLAGDEGPPDAEGGGESASEYTPIRIEVAMPPALRAAFAESLELFRCVAGGQATIPEFVEALLAECECEPGDGSMGRPPDVAGIGPRRPSRAGKKRGEARSDETWARLVGRGSSREPSDALAALIEEVDNLAREALASRPGSGGGDVDDALRHLRELLVAEARLRVALGEVLDRLRRTRPFCSGGRGLVPFASLAHYAEERLGLSASVAERLARLHRGTRRYAALRESYENGLSGENAALAVLRLLDRSAGARAAEGVWVNAAECCTLRRIDDEARALEMRDALRPRGGEALEPLADREWLASCSRKPGESSRRVRVLAAHALCHAAERRQRVMYLDLPFELALALEQALDDAARSQVCTSIFAAPHERRGTPPRWAAFLALLLEAVHEWDGQAEEHTPREWARRTYARDGYRCMAPGCTSRACLEEHHVVYRSQGGTDEASNRVTLCRFHHQQGEHGGLMRVLGTAPDALLWRLGPEGERSRWFEADRRR